MNIKIAYIRNFLAGAKVAQVFSEEEIDSIKTACELIIMNRAMPDAYQTITIEKAAALLDLETHAVTKLWKRHNRPMLKFYRAQQAGVRLYLKDFIELNQIFVENRSVVKITNLPKKKSIK